MKKSAFSLLILMCSLFASCTQEPEQPEECCDTFDFSQDAAFSGTWRVFEYGYSPGAGYIVEPVAADPAQLLTLGTDGSFSSNYGALSEYKYYELLDDPQSDNRILALFTEYTEHPDTDNLEQSYSVTVTDRGVSLSYRWCFEGCHIGIRKVSVTD